MDDLGRCECTGTASGSADPEETSITTSQSTGTFAEVIASGSGRDHSFRDAVLTRDGKCRSCRLSIAVCLEAAHVIPLNHRGGLRFYYRKHKLGSINDTL